MLLVSSFCKPNSSFKPTVNNTGKKSLDQSLVHKYYRNTRWIGLGGYELCPEWISWKASIQGSNALKVVQSKGYYCRITITSYNIFAKMHTVCDNVSNILQNIWHFFIYQCSRECIKRSNHLLLLKAKLHQDINMNVFVCGADSLPIEWYFKESVYILRDRE